MRYDILKFAAFSYIIHVIAQKGQLSPPPIDNVWENCKLHHCVKLSNIDHHPGHPPRHFPSPIHLCVHHHWHPHHLSVQLHVARQ